MVGRIALEDVKVITSNAMADLVASGQARLLRYTEFDINFPVYAIGNEVYAKRTSNSQFYAIHPDNAHYYLDKGIKQ